MESDLWRGFLAVAEHRSFTAAAATLPVSQSGLSQQIRRLEGLLGVSLFERSTRDVQLSEVGAEVIVAARELIAAEDDLLARVRWLRDADDLTQVLTVYVMENGIGHLLIDIVERARHRIPGLRVEVEQVSIEEQSSVLADSTEAAVLIGRPPFSPQLAGARRTVLGADSLCLVVPKHFDIADEVTVAEALQLDRRSMPWLPDEWKRSTPLFEPSTRRGSDVMVATNFKNAIQAVGIDDRPCVAPITIAKSYVVPEEARIVSLTDGPQGVIELVSASQDPLVAAFHDEAVGSGTDGDEGVFEVPDLEVVDS
ncbi:MAG: LysR family transcriptional regulator [Ilumatobacter sp.]